MINFLLTTEIIPLCLRIMESGSELSKTVRDLCVQANPFLLIVVCKHLYSVFNLLCICVCRLFIVHYMHVDFRA